MSVTFENLPTDQTNEVWVGALEVTLTTPDGQPCKDQPFKLDVEGGGTSEGKTDDQGVLRASGMKPGTTAVLTLPGMPLAVLEVQQ
jgi:hypothetical protein